VARRILLLLLFALVFASTSSAQEPVAAGPVQPPPFKLPTVVSWLLNSAGPCPNCDAVQTWVGRKPTPLFSPLPAGKHGDARAGHLVSPAPATAPNPLDQVAWEQWRVLLPAGLRTKPPSS
jgi:hypothetical protein